MAYCRAGFEGDLAGELDDEMQTRGFAGFARAKAMNAWVVYECVVPVRPETLAESIDFNDLIFARQLYFTFARVTQLPERKRGEVLLEAVKLAAQRFGEVVLETPDTNEGKQLSGFCRRFQGPFEALLTEARLLRPQQKDAPVLHILFDSEDSAWLGWCLPGRANPWPMGVPRLRMPRQAPSHSTLKLAEAFMCMLSEQELSQSIRPGARAVDIGAAPGGWTWQLVQRGLRVTAIDNGPMSAEIMATEMVEHFKTDGFTYKPARPVDWMVCDMVEQPTRIAALAADWVGFGRCRHALFNLKLPMKRRLEAVRNCEAIIAKRLKSIGAFDLRIKHLYHDREEVTAYLRLK